MRDFFRQWYARPMNPAILMGVPLLVIAWHLIATHDKSRLEKIAAEFVGTKDFFNAPSPNHAGTKLLYIETTENGINGYYVDIAGGGKKLLFDHDATHLAGVKMLGWSSDDTLFAYVNSTPDQKITLCDGNSAQPVGTVSVSGNISEVVWLSDAAFVYANNSQDLTLVRKTGDKWRPSALFDKQAAAVQNPPNNTVVVRLPNGTTRTVAQRSPAAAPMQNLVAMDEKFVAWQQGGTLWMYSLGSDAPVKVWESTTNTLVNFCFLGGQNAFRLHCKDRQGEFVFTLFPAAIWRDDRITEPERINPVVDPKILNLSFIQNGLGYAYLVHGLTTDAIVIQKPDSNSPPVQLAWDAGVDSVAVNDSHVYVVGSTNGPLDIWDYDVKSGSLTSVVPGIENPFKYAKTVAATHQIATNAAGGTVIWHLSPPVDYVAGKKYPLVIMFSGIRWRAQEGNVPAAGSFVAACNGITDEQGVIAIYHSAVENPDIDTNRVYVLGSSSSAVYAVRLLQDRPDLWHGAILLSPLAFPDVSRLKVSRILIDSASGDAYLSQVGGTSRLIQFQDAAAAAGIPVTLSINPGGAHIYKSKSSIEERVRQTLEFVAANK